MLRRALRSALIAFLSLLLLPAAASGWWGGTYATGAGEQVRVLLSDTYPVDEARARYWAETLAGLVHGPELSRLTAHVAPIDEVHLLCGLTASGCYSPLDSSLLVPGEALPGVSAESVLAHEYGHHIANNRANPPWSGLDWGPKRWASYARVCQRERAGNAFPGRVEQYRLEPGEAFAEAYRVLNETRAGAVDFTWPIVDWSFRPDATALRLVYEDVVHPWKPTTRRVRGALAGGSGVYETLLTTPYDGVLTARVAPARFRLRLVDPLSGRVLARGRNVKRTICGERSVLLQVLGDGRAGRFTLRVARP